MSEPSGRPGTYTHFFIWSLVIAGLYLTSRYSLLLFHDIVGLFSVVIAVGVFAVAWNSRGFLENNYLLFLGIAYLCVGALDRFTYAVSHELGSLLRWINGYCRALEENWAHRLDFRRRRYLRRLHEAIRMARELIDALVHHSRIATAAMRRQEIDLSVQARAIAQDLQRAAPARRGKFSIEPGLTAAGDPAMLRVVLSNLLGNAWKFTKKVSQGKIEFGALPATDGCRGFLVRDNRTGCPLYGGRHRLRAFEPQQTIRDFSGAEVGLAMVQRIIQWHGGRVWAEIDHQQGTTFYFTLPKGGQASAAEPAGEDQPNSSTG